MTIGDVLELADTETSTMVAWPRALPAFYGTLRELGFLGDEAPARWRQLRTAGQRTPEELVDRYDIACRPTQGPDGCPQARNAFPLVPAYDWHECNRHKPIV